jgi:hypothetical protein
MTPHLEIPPPIPPIVVRIADTPALPRLTKTTRLAFQYLRARTDRQRLSAFERLRAILLHATQHLFIPRYRSFEEDSPTERYLFVSRFLREYLDTYKGRSKEELRAAALADKFRYLGRLCKFRVLDEIKRVNRIRAKQASVDELDKCASPYNEYHALREDDLVRVLALCDFLSERQVHLVWSLWRACEAKASALVSGGLRKGERTQAIANARHVSLQQARKDLRNLRQAFANAVESGDPGARAFFELLATASLAKTFC